MGMETFFVLLTVGSFTVFHTSLYMLYNKLKCFLYQITQCLSSTYWPVFALSGLFSGF